MKKYYVTLALVSAISFTQNIFCCPCNASTTDKRPFFEQYESTQGDTKDETTDSTNDSTKMEQS